MKIVSKLSYYDLLTITLKESVNITLNMTLNSKIDIYYSKTNSITNP